MTKLSEAQRQMLRDANPWTYCGYSPEAYETAEQLESLGYGEIAESALVPVFFITEAGRAALEKGE